MFNTDISIRNISARFNVHHTIILKLLQ